MTIRTDIPEWTIASAVKHINFPVGAKRTHRIDVVDAAAAAQAMTGWTLKYVWRDAGGALAVSKATSGSGITIGNGSGTDDRATVTIDRADTEDLSPGTYLWALWRTDGTNDDVLAEGKLVLSAPAAQPPEEE